MGTSLRAVLPVVATLGLSLALASCSSDGGASTTPTPDAGVPGGDGCAAGFALDPVIGACTEIAAGSDCPAGTMPEIGHAECQPVGWTSACPEGFQQAPSGWGCIDRFPVPAPTCQGATREDVKTGTCVPIGDCNAPFPPAAATLFVDDDGIEDATHFHTLTQAMAKAKAGATIAVEAGTYAEVIEYDADKLSVVGRCAEKVIFKGPVGPRSGGFVPGSAGAKLSGVTITGFVGGFLMEGGDLVIEDTLIDANPTLGIYLRFAAKATVRRSKVSRTSRGTGALASASVVYDGSVLSFEDSALVDNYFRHATVTGPGSTLNAVSTVFARNTMLTGEEAAIALDKGGAAKLSRSAILDSVTSGLRVFDAGSHAELEESVIRRTSGTVKGSGGVGVFAATKGVVKLVSSAVTDNPVLGVYAGKDGGTVTLTTSVITGLPPGSAVEFGRGAGAAEKGRLEMKDTAVIGCPQSGVGVQFGASGTFDRIYVKDSRPIKDTIGDYGGFGMLVENDSTVTVTQSSFVGNALAGLSSVLGASVTAEGILVRDTHELPGLSAGSGVQIARAGTLTMTRSALSGNSQETVLVASGGAFVMSASTVHGTKKAEDGLFGHGITVFAGARAELTDVAVYDSLGVGLISDGGQARVIGGTFYRNQVALHAQNGAAIAQSDDATGDLATGEVRISGATRFVDNATRVGTGEVPVPKAPLD